MHIYNSTAYYHDTQLVMRKDEMYETCDIHNYCMLYTTKKRPLIDMLFGMQMFILIDT